MSSKTSSWRQFYSVSCGNLLSLALGSSNGWASVNFLELQKSSTSLPSGPMTLPEATFMMSVTFTSAAIGIPMFPFVAKRFGNKNGLFCVGFLQILSLLLIIYAQNPYYLYVARILTGFVNAALQVFLAIFILEISHNHIRGTLLSIFDPCVNFGTIIAFILAKYFDYVTQAKFQLITAIAFVILFARIPESPQHLLKMQREKAANRANKFFKGTEMDLMPVDLGARQPDSAKLTLNDFINRRARKAAFIGISGFALAALQGFGVLISYVTEIFTTTNSSISANNASIIILTILIVSNLVFINMVDRAGRRTLFIWSSFVTAIILAIFIVYLHSFAENRALDWVPIVSLSSALFISCLGMNPIPFIVTLEVLPQKIKGYIFPCCIILQLTIQFILVEIYPMAKEHIGLVGWITFFTLMCLCNALFGILVMPETKGKSYDEIMQILDE